MRGFQPQNRSAKATTADAAPVRGFKPRSAERAQALNQQPDTIPAMMKPGEFVLPPDTVHAVGGKEALQQVVDATHTPAPDAAVVPRGFQPRAYFSQGGAPEDVVNRVSSPSNTFPGNRTQGTSGLAGAPVGLPGRGGSQRQADVASATAAGGAVGLPSLADRVAQIPTGGPKAPAADGSQNSWANTETGRNVSNLAKALPGAAGNLVGGVARTGGAISGAINSGSLAARGLATGAALGTAGAAAAPIPASAAPAPAGQQPLPAGVAPSTTGAGRGSVNPPMADPSAQPPAPSASPMVAPGVYRHGQGQYSDQPGGMGMPRGFTGQPSARNDAAAESLVRGFQPGMRASVAADNPTRGFTPAGVSAPTVLHSGNSWQARNDLRNLEVSASSITNRPGWEGAGMGRYARQQGTPAATQTYQAAQAADIAARGAQPAYDMKAAQENAAIQREGVQQQGANTRAAMSAGVDQQRLGIEGRKADSQLEAQGYQNRAAAQQEQLRALLADPKASVIDKMQAQKTLRAMAGQGDSWKAVALQGGTDAQGNKTESVLGAVNERTGEMKRMDAGQGGAKLPQVGAVEGGYRFKGGDPGNPASWEKA